MNEDAISYIMQKMSNCLDNSQMISLEKTLDSGPRRSSRACARRPDGAGRVRQGPGGGADRGGLGGSGKAGTRGGQAVVAPRAAGARPRVPASSASPGTTSGASLRAVNWIREAGGMPTTEGANRSPGKPYMQIGGPGGPQIRSG